MTPGGLGPWFCALFFNTSTDSKKQTHLIAHTLPHLACDMLNRNGAASGDSWIIMLKIGPFSDWNVAIAFLEQWMSRKRGKQRRLERGVELFALYRQQYGLVLWSQARADIAASAAREQQVDDNDNEEDDNAMDCCDAEEELPAATAAAATASAGSDQQATRLLLNGVRQSFEAQSSLTIHGLVGICTKFGMSSSK